VSIVKITLHPYDWIEIVYPAASMRWEKKAEGDYLAARNLRLFGEALDAAIPLNMPPHFDPRRRLTPAQAEQIKAQGFALDRAALVTVTLAPAIREGLVKALAAALVHEATNPAVTPILLAAKEAAEAAKVEENGEAKAP
jgi:hypothetical protein